LGQHGVNIAAFCKEYNARTSDKIGLIIPVEISVYQDRSYTFVLKTPPASVLLANAAKIKKGSSTPNKVSVGSITKSQLEEIATIKLPDLNTTKISSAIRIVEGTARNMGISIVD
jgi:large subunit ribosomal protein L11